MSDQEHEAGRTGSWAAPGSNPSVPPGTPPSGPGDGGPFQAYPGTPTWPTAPDQQLVERQPAYAPPTGGPQRSPGRGGVRALLIGMALAGALFLVAMFLIGGSFAPEGFDDGEFGEESPFIPPTSIDVEAPPQVSNPPADGDAAVSAIGELEQFIFTPNPDPAAWEERFTDPTGLRAKIEPYASTQCAVGVRTVVVAVRFIDENHAEVDFVFVGPNVPDVGSTFVFTGEVERVPGGPWLATPSGVEQVAALATGYCMREEPSPREGLEDGTDGIGTHDEGEPASPLQR